MTERALASVRRIDRIDPIEGADQIERLTIDGWELVSQKGNFRPGDLCIYFEIDSVLPTIPVFEFLRSRCYVERDWIQGYRIRTIKLRKQVSQGLALPLHEFAVILPNWQDYSEGTDVTEQLGVLKWDPPISAQLAGKAKGNFPSFIPKTDQNRIQNVYKKLVRDHLNDMWEVTMQLDGSSMTVYVQFGENDEYHFGICSRNLELVVDYTSDNAFIKTALKYEKFFLHAGRNLAFQGELMGPGIQGNREGFDDHRFFIFDIYDIDRGRYLLPDERNGLLNSLSIWGFARPDVVPYMTTASFYRPTDGRINEVSDLLLAAENRSINPSVVAEGLVFKHTTIPGLSFKVINNKYLLKEE